MLDVSAGIGRNVPPVGPEYDPHFEWGISFNAAISDYPTFVATLGLAVENAVVAWAGDGEAVGSVRTGPYTGTTPRDFQGHFVRLTPQLRLGARNHQALGYFAVTPGYALRSVKLMCVATECLHGRAIDHGFTLGAAIGAVAWVGNAMAIGGEVGLDSALFPNGHPQLEAWNQGVSAKLLVGWTF
jgi:hypothetical protein